MGLDDYIFKQPDGKPGIHEEFHTGSAIFYSYTPTKSITFFASGFATVPIEARVLERHEKLPKEYHPESIDEFDCTTIYTTSYSELMEFLKSKEPYQRITQFCFVEPQKSADLIIEKLRKAINSYSSTFELQSEVSFQYKDIKPADFCDYLTRFFLNPTKQFQTQEGLCKHLMSFENFMESYPVEEHVSRFMEIAQQDRKSKILDEYAEVFIDMKQEDYRAVSERLKKISSRLQSV